MCVWVFVSVCGCKLYFCKVSQESSSVCHHTKKNVYMRCVVMVGVRVKSEGGGVGTLVVFCNVMEYEVAMIGIYVSLIYMNIYVYRIYIIYMYIYIYTYI